jgi:hypothetical protein
MLGLIFDVIGACHSAHGVFTLFATLNPFATLNLFATLNPSFSPGPPSQHEIAQFAALDPPAELLKLLRDAASARHDPTKDYDSIFRQKFSHCHPDALLLLREMLRFNATPPQQSPLSALPPMPPLPAGWQELTNVDSGRS